MNQVSIRGGNEETTREHAIWRYLMRLILYREFQARAQVNMLQCTAFIGANCAVLPVGLFMIEFLSGLLQILFSILNSNS